MGKSQFGWKEAEAAALAAQKGDESGVEDLCKFVESSFGGYVESRVASARRRQGLKSGMLYADDFFGTFRIKTLNNLRRKNFHGGNFAGWMYTSIERALIDYVEDPSLKDKKEEEPVEMGREEEPDSRTEDERPAGRGRRGAIRVSSLDAAIGEDEDGATLADAIEDPNLDYDGGNMAYRVVLNDYLAAARAIKNSDHSAAFFGRVFLRKDHGELSEMLGLATLSTARGNFRRAILDIGAWFKGKPDYDGLNPKGLAVFALKNFVIEERDLDAVTDKRLREVLAAARQHKGSMGDFARDLGLPVAEAKAVLRKALTALSQAELTRRLKSAAKPGEAAVAESLWKLSETLLKLYPKPLPAVRAGEGDPDPELSGHLEAAFRLLYQAFGVAPEKSLGALLRERIPAAKYQEAALRLGLSRQDLRRLLSDGFKPEEVEERLIAGLSAYVGVPADDLARARTVPPARGAGDTRALTDEEKRKYEEVLARRKG